MDASTIISIVISLFSIGISVFFAYTGYRLTHQSANESGKTLEHVQTKIDELHDNFIVLLREAQTNYKELASDSRKDLHSLAHTMAQVVIKDSKEDFSKEKAESLEKKLYEAALQLTRQDQSNSISVLSKHGRVGEKKAPS